MTPAQARSAELAAKYRAAIEYVTTHFADRSERDRKRFLNRLVEACEEALIYSWGEVSHRDEDQAAFCTSKTIANQARKVAAFCRANAGVMMLPIAKAAGASGVTLRVKEDPDDVGQDTFFGPGLSYRLAKLLDAVADEVADLRSNAIAFQHRMRMGPLHFEKLIDRRTASKSTCLAAFMLFLIKRFSGTGLLSFTSGEGMPGAGEPHWALVDMLVSAAYGPQSDVKSSVEKLVRDNPQLRVIGYR